MTKKHLLLTLTLAATLVLPLSAQSTKLGVIDLRKVFDNYWKTKQADTNLKEEANGFERERKAMVDDFQKKQDEYKKLLDSACDPAASTDERDKRKKGSEDLLLKLKEIQNNLEQFDRQARAQLGEKQRRMRDNILVEIKDVIKAKAKAGGYFSVVDNAAESVNNTPILLYTSGENDITDEVLSQLNLNAPPPPPTAEKKDGRP
ncbi:MAG: OmpH family outer membrane protein [Verrucomicrobia bacterium]|nr:OmpH family outer membrane protein [Verrucomicrobiota bacterium]